MLSNLVVFLELFSTLAQNAVASYPRPLRLDLGSVPVQMAMGVSRPRKYFFFVEDLSPVHVSVPFPLCVVVRGVLCVGRRGGTEGLVFVWWCRLSLVPQPTRAFLYEQGRDIREFTLMARGYIIEYFWPRLVYNYFSFCVPVATTRIGACLGYLSEFHCTTCRERMYNVFGASVHHLVSRDLWRSGGACLSSVGCHLGEYAF